MSAKGTSSTGTGPGWPGLGALRRPGHDDGDQGEGAYAGEGAMASRIALRSIQATAFAARHRWTAGMAARHLWG
jgi:hypothetical protein